MSERAYSDISDLPETFPIFPLNGVILFPGGVLPLNVFEPRYLNMVDDAMSGDGMIGMVQSLNAGPRHHPDIVEVGTLGRIVHYSETDDGRYLISLEGVCRFRIDHELEFERPYRQAFADWSLYADDLQQAKPDVSEREKKTIIRELEDYLCRNQLRADWDSVEDASPDLLINALSTSCPFSAMEKQALLEAKDLSARAECLIALFQMDASDDGDQTWLN